MCSYLIRNIVIFLFSFFYLSFAVFASNHLWFKYESTNPFIQPVNITKRIPPYFNFKDSSITLRVRMDGVYKNEIKGTMLGVAEKDRFYISFYIIRNKNEDKIGAVLLDKRNNKIEDVLNVNLPISDAFHTITYNFNLLKDKIELYIDGKKMKEVKYNRFLIKMAKIDAAYLGGIPTKSNKSRFIGEYYYADISQSSLTKPQIIAKHRRIENRHLQALKYDADMRINSGAEKSSPISLFFEEEKSAINYRIPTLLTTKNGVVIAVSDKRYQHNLDWGNIDTVIRRSIDGGKTWQKEQTIIDLASQKYGTKNSAFTIDPLLVQDKSTGRIFLLVGMYPEMKGFFDIKAQTWSQKNAYKKIDNVYYQTLTDDVNRQYTIREKGIIFDANNQITDYRVILQGDSQKHFNNLGDLYQKEKRVGNIFLQSKYSGNDSAPLRVKKTSYLWLIYSDNDGETWSNPIDITPQVKADWMNFLGPAPGVGIQLKNGHLIMPIYYTNQYNKQAAAVIISKDGGKTWQRGQSPLDISLSSEKGTREFNDSSEEITESQLVELDNGEIKLFSRSHKGHIQIATSYDGGYSWSNKISSDPILLDPYSQLSVIKYSKHINHKSYLLFANPHSATKDRVNGQVWLGEVKHNGDISWKNTIKIDTKHYAYNCLTELPNGDIGLIYEKSSKDIRYLRFNLKALFWQNNKKQVANNQ